MDIYKSATELMKEQLGHDVIISLATCTENGVNVRNVDGYYKDGFVYVVTHSCSQKMIDISKNSKIAICKDLMSAQGIGKNLGNPKAESNRELRDELKKVFVAFYERHVYEDDPGSCILEITLTKAAVFSKDTKYTIDYQNETATATPFVNDIIY
ncbi:MAG: pyridoxamine 5-phosphate oxidase family protein [Haloplasmataceae bacterium]|jgi:general stress protein 26|nr:pyridoxamine 5-phosphate oxidase family protein [Haloplasmataceae bacterium]